MKPKLDGGTLTFEVAVLEGSLSGGSGPAALFIDPGLFNYWHAPVYHGSWYARPAIDDPGLYYNPNSIECSSPQAQSGWLLLTCGVRKVPEIGSYQCPWCTDGPAAATRRHRHLSKKSARPIMYRAPDKDRLSGSPVVLNVPNSLVLECVAGFRPTSEQG